MDKKELLEAQTVVLNSNIEIIVDAIQRGEYGIAVMWINFTVHVLEVIKQGLSLEKRSK